nr:hypothetical protein CFP56_25423 [Quercus suber]POF19028.1 hypothetical protein CFP56_26458 [Quercus suber]
MELRQAPDDHGEEQKQFGLGLRAAPFSPTRKNVLSIPGFYKLRQNSIKSPVTSARTETGAQDFEKEMVSEPSAEAGLKPPPNGRDGDWEAGINGSAEVSKQNLKQTITLHNSPPIVTLQAETVEPTIHESLTPTQSNDLQLKEIDEALNVIDSEKYSAQNGNHAAPLFPELNTINAPPVVKLSALPN